jgi:cytochrome c oxidase subunit 2
MAALVRSKLLLGGVLAAAVLLLAPAGLAGNGGFAPPPAESPNAQGIRESYFWIAIFTGAVLVLVQGALIVFIVKYRRRRPRDEDGPQIHGNTKLEIGWTVAPVLILVAIGSFVFYKLPGIHDVPPATAAGGREEVAVEGRQFYWQFTYPNGAVAVDRMRVPAGRNVRLTVTAPGWDVIHSWWIPELGGKIDAIPGTTNHTWFRADRPGVYEGQCAELCGLQHARLTAAVELLPRAEFDSWLSARAGGEGLGEETYDGVCAKCHGLQGQGDIGPQLVGNALLNDRAGIERLLRNGKNRMPAVGKDWGDEQMTAITDYLREEIVGGQG